MNFSVDSIILSRGYSLIIRMNINKATKVELESLPGIGDARALSIIKARQEHGGRLTMDHFITMPEIPRSVWKRLIDEKWVIFPEEEELRQAIEEVSSKVGAMTLESPANVTASPGQNVEDNSTVSPKPGVKVEGHGGGEFDYLEDQGDSSPDFRSFEVKTPSPSHIGDFMADVRGKLHIYKSKYYEYRAARDEATRDCEGLWRGIKEKDHLLEQEDEKVRQLTEEREAADDLALERKKKLDLLLEQIEKTEGESYQRKKQLEQTEKESEQRREQTKLLRQQIKQMEDHAAARGKRMAAEREEYRAKVKAEMQAMAEERLAAEKEEYRAKVKAELQATYQRKADHLRNKGEKWLETMNERHAKRHEELGLEEEELREKQEWVTQKDEDLKKWEKRLQIRAEELEKEKSKKVTSKVELDLQDIEAEFQRKEAEIRQEEREKRKLERTLLAKIEVEERQKMGMDHPVEVDEESDSEASVGSTMTKVLRTLDRIAPSSHYRPTGKKGPSLTGVAPLAVSSKEWREGRSGEGGHRESTWRKPPPVRRNLWKEDYCGRDQGDPNYSERTSERSPGRETSRGHGQHSREESSSSYRRSGISGGSYREVARASERSPGRGMSHGYGQCSREDSLSKYHQRSEGGRKSRLPVEESDYYESGDERGSRKRDNDRRPKSSCRRRSPHRSRAFFSSDLESEDDGYSPHRSQSREYTCRSRRSQSRGSYGRDSGWKKEPKVANYDGKTPWRAYEVQFNHIAGKHDWTREEKLDKLVQALRDKALTFYSSLPETTRESYTKLSKKLNNRFGPKEPPRTVRKQLAMLKQEPEEKLEEFAERTQRAAGDAWGEYDEGFSDTIAVDAFLQGCSDKNAALYAIEREPDTMDQALDLVRKAVHNHRLLFGSKSPSYPPKVRAVQFAESPRPERKSESAEVDELRQKLGALDQSMKAQGGKMDQLLGLLQRAPASPQMTRRGGGCFRCGKEGHFAMECTQTRSPIRRSGGCFRCGKEGHFAMECTQAGSPSRLRSPSGRNSAMAGSGSPQRRANGSAAPAASPSTTRGGGLKD